MTEFSIEIKQYDDEDRNVVSFSHYCRANHLATCLGITIEHAVGSQLRIAEELAEAVLMVESDDDHPLRIELGKFVDSADKFRKAIAVWRSGVSKPQEAGNAQATEVPRD